MPVTETDPVIYPLCPPGDEPSRDATSAGGRRRAARPAPRRLASGLCAEYDRDAPHHGHAVQGVSRLPLPRWLDWRYGARLNAAARSSPPFSTLGTVVALYGDQGQKTGIDRRRYYPAPHR